MQFRKCRNFFLPSDVKKTWLSSGACYTSSTQFIWSNFPIAFKTVKKKKGCPNCVFPYLQATFFSSDLGAVKRAVVRGTLISSTQEGKLLGKKKEKFFPSCVRTDGWLQVEDV